jgi:AcrR family transcriptional regulator
LVSPDSPENGSESTASRYRPGLNPRGEDTRRRILEIAIEVFADEGYECASTRMLAERAGVNLPAIQYYFGSKEGLYRAAIDHIAHIIAERTAPTAERVLKALADDHHSPQALFDLLFEMMDGFLDLLTCRIAPPSAVLLITRAEIENAAALDILQQTVMRLVFRPCVMIVARLLGTAEDDDETKLRAFSILGQALVFKSKGSKMGACPALGWDVIGEERMAALRAVLHEQTEAILRAAMSKPR